MMYMGSKRRIAKEILEIIVPQADNLGITKWVEPFVGGGNMIQKVPNRFERIGYDINPHTIYAMIDIRDNPDGFPDEVTKEEYLAMKGTPPDTITSWVRFVCSFGGKFNSGYSRDKRGQETLAIQGKRNALKQSPELQGVQFICDSYENLNFSDCVIYCDPPYENTTGYKGVSSFDHEKFWEWCRVMSSKNLVFVSEANGPDDFVLLWEKEIGISLANQKGFDQNKRCRVERLYQYKDLPIINGIQAKFTEPLTQNEMMIK